MKIKYADTFWLRLRGLLGTQTIERQEGLFLENCRRVHSMGMKYSIAVFYLDENYVVLGKEILRPNRFGLKISGTVHVLETHPDLFTRFKIGQKLEKIVRSEMCG